MLVGQTGEGTSMSDLDQAHQSLVFKKDIIHLETQMTLWIIGVVMVLSFIVFLRINEFMTMISFITSGGLIGVAFSTALRMRILLNEILILELQIL